MQININTNTDAIDTNSNNINTNNQAISVMMGNDMYSSDLDSNIVDNVCDDEYYVVTGEYCGEWVGATIKKISFWGEEI